MRLGRPVNATSDMYPYLGNYTGNYTAAAAAGAAAGAIQRRRRRKQRAVQKMRKRVNDKMKQPPQRMKLRMNNVMWTYARYHMHPILYSVEATGMGGVRTPYFTDGRGPLLNSVLNQDVTDKRFGNIFGTNVEEFNSTVLTGKNQTAISRNSYMFTYVFCADYPFNTMLPVCQKGGTSSAVCHLTWETINPEATTDPNLPITLSDIVGNKDWNRIAHAATYLYFDFSNYAYQTMIVEVLLFKYIVDVDAMSYTQLIDAPLSRQYAQKYTSYCEMRNMQLGTKQIRVIKRIRFRMRGNQNISATSQQGEDTALKNYNFAFMPKFRKLKLKVRREYSIKRPIATSYETSITDNAFFNTYYEYDKGVYCRMQAWPEDSNFSMIRKGIVGETTKYYSAYQVDTSLMESCKLNAAANETPTTTDYRVAQGVSCYLEKKSFIKLDEPMLKGPFRI